MVEKMSIFFFCVSFFFFRMGNISWSMYIHWVWSSYKDVWISKVSMSDGKLHILLKKTQFFGGSDQWYQARMKWEVLKFQRIASSNVEFCTKKRVLSGHQMLMSSFFEAGGTPDDVSGRSFKCELRPLGLKRRSFVALGLTFQDRGKAVFDGDRLQRPEKKHKGRGLEV